MGATAFFDLVFKDGKKDKCKKECRYYYTRECKAKKEKICDGNDIYDNNDYRNCKTTYRKQCDYEVKQDCQTHYAQVCHSGGYGHQECQSVPKQECRSYKVPHCKRVPQQVCKNKDKKKDCRKVYVYKRKQKKAKECKREELQFYTDYRTEYKEVCANNPVPKCYTTYEKECDYQTRQACKTQYQTECHDEQRQVCSTHHEEAACHGYHCEKVPKQQSCHYVTEKKCKQVPHEVCNDYTVPHCHQVPKQHCTKEYKQECHKVPTQVPIQRQQYICAWPRDRKQDDDRC